MFLPGKLTRLEFTMKISKDTEETTRGLFLKVCQTLLAFAWAISLQSKSNQQQVRHQKNNLFLLKKSIEREALLA